jgi:GNAT superfamily N-acetyltransferase
MSAPIATRVAAPGDAGELATLLHDFNTEFDTPSPGPAVLEPRLRSLLASDSTVALLAGSPAEGCALVTLRPNVWFDGPVALLDELYVVPDRRGEGIGTALVELLFEVAADRDVELIEINVDESDVDAQRFYERHGFSGIEPDTGERAFYFSLEPGRPQ